MTTPDISLWSLAAGYLLLIIPLAILLWYRIPLVSQMLTSIVRMSLQLLFVGLYLQVVFDLNSLWLTALWLVIMITVADASIIHGCGLRLHRVAWPLFIALICGTAIPLFFFMGPILQRPHLLDAQFAIPIGGMILGNCLRADIIGVRNFFNGIRDGENVFLLSLSQGASLSEAVRPYLREACMVALAPTLATIATVGLVSLPGMMTGVILGGVNPMVAIKYQIAIMIAIFSGTAITVSMALWLTMRQCFSRWGTLDRSIFSVASK
jgi:putative ABC transport system permease protein